VAVAKHVWLAQRHRRDLLQDCRKQVRQRNAEVRVMRRWQDMGGWLFQVLRMAEEGWLAATTVTHFQDMPKCWRHRNALLRPS
jgi:hypothetical protein